MWGLRVCHEFVSSYFPNVVGSVEDRRVRSTSQEQAAMIPEDVAQRGGDSGLRDGRGAGRYARITMKTIDVCGFDQRVNCAAKIRNVSKVGSRISHNERAGETETKEVERTPPP